MPTVTIRAIARHTGLSKTTVAAALKGDRDYTAATVAQVRAAAQELGYRPNPLVTAAMMKIRDTRLSRSRGITLAYLSDLGRKAMLQPGGSVEMGLIGAKERAQDLGFNLDLIDYGNTDMTPGRVRRVIQSRGIRGFVVAPHTRPQIELDWRWEEFAVVCIGFSVTSPRFDRVGYDHHEAIVEVCHRMWQQGRRRLGLVLSADFDARVLHVARAGFLRWQTDHVGKALPIPVVDGGNTAGLRTWYRRHRPDCIIAQGRGILEILAEVGIENSSNSTVVTPTLTSGYEHLGGYDMSLRRLAGCAVELLAGKLYRNEYGIPSIRQTVLVLGPWVDPTSAKDAM
jgi:LacI family transcriptional regulator